MFWSRIQLTLKKLYREKKTKREKVVTIDSDTLHFFPRNMMMKNLKKKLDRNENLILSKEFYEIAHFFIGQKASRVRLLLPLIFTLSQCKRVAEDLETIICAPRHRLILGKTVEKPEMIKAIDIFHDELYEILSFLTKGAVNQNCALIIQYIPSSDEYVYDEGMFNK